MARHNVLSRKPRGPFPDDQSSESHRASIGSRTRPTQILFSNAAKASQPGHGKLCTVPTFGSPVAARAARKLWPRSTGGLCSCRSGHDPLRTSMLSASDARNVDLVTQSGAPHSAPTLPAHGHCYGHRASKRFVGTWDRSRNIMSPVRLRTPDHRRPGFFESRFILSKHQGCIYGAGHPAVIPRTRSRDWQSGRSRSWSRSTLEEGHRHRVSDNTWLDTSFRSSRSSTFVDRLSIQDRKQIHRRIIRMRLAFVQITTNEASFRVNRYEDFYESTERFASPESCYSALKGLRTLSVRMTRHEASALEIAKWLEAHAAVETVIYPALETHPEHHLWRRDLTGASGVFGFILKKDPTREELSTFLDPMNIFALGLSWGRLSESHQSGERHRSRPTLPL